jgi:NADH dehydrogenase FAD-containing subunit
MWYEHGGHVTVSKDNKILIIGGGFAGARTAQELAKAGFENVTLIDRKDYFEVTYSTLRTVVQPEMGGRARISYEDFIKCAFRRSEVTELQARSATLSNGTSVPFDIAVVATGSSYHTFPIAKSQDATTMAERAQEFTAEHESLKVASKVLIIGGGPVGVEFAGEIADHFPEKTVTLAEGSDRLLGALKPKASRIAEKQLKSLGVKIIYSTRLSQEDEAYRNADVVYMCVGQTANTHLMKANFASKLDRAGRIKVDDKLRMEGSENIFAIGDCANAPGVKLGYLADIQGALIAKNLAAAAKGKGMKSYKLLPMVALVPIGLKKGLVQMPGIVTTFRPMVNMKQKDMFISRQYGNLGVKR